jgi:hypothetical protein
MAVPPWSALPTAVGSHLDPIAELAALYRREPQVIHLVIYLGMLRLHSIYIESPARCK